MAASEESSAWKLITEKFHSGIEVDLDEIYKDWAGTYDTELHGIGYDAPLHGADYLAKYGEKTDLYPSDPILDLGAGTGLVGKRLSSSYGFTNIVALDGSSDMLKIAEDLGVYKKLVQAWLDPKIPLPFEDNSFKGVTLVGALGGSHIPFDILPDIIRVTKSGGILVIVVRHLAMETELVELPSYCDKLESKGKWKCLVKEIPADNDGIYYMDHKAYVLVYQML